MAFTGDTAANWVDSPDAAQALSARLLIMECTFIDDSVSREKAREMGHTHVDEIAENAARGLFDQCEAVLLIHFSARYRRGEILAALDARLPPALRAKVTPLLGGHAPSSSAES